MFPGLTKEKTNAGRGDSAEVRVIKQQGVFKDPHPGLCGSSEVREAAVGS